MYYKSVVTQTHFGVEDKIVIRVFHSLKQNSWYCSTLFTLFLIYLIVSNVFRFWAANVILRYCVFFFFFFVFVSMYTISIRNSARIFNNNYKRWFLVENWVLLGGYFLTFFIIKILSRPDEKLRKRWYNFFEGIPSL